MQHNIKNNVHASPPVTSSDIVANIASGNKAFESVLVNQYFAGLLFILNKRANDVELATDIAQETFIIVIQKARNNQIEKPEALKAFIRQVGINLLLAHYRKESRQATSTDEHIDLASANEFIEHFKALNDSKLLEQVIKFIREMPTERDREILQNYFVYEKNKEQICLDLNIDSAHFDRVLFRSRERLKKMIQTHFPELNYTSKNKISLLLTALLTLGVTAQMPNDVKKINNNVRGFQLSEHYKEQETNLTKGKAYSRYPVLPIQSNIWSDYEYS